MAVVNDFLADVDGSAVEIESDFDDVDGAYDASAEPARFEEQNLLFAGGGSGLGGGIVFDQGISARHRRNVQV